MAFNNVTYLFQHLPPLLISNSSIALAPGMGSYQTKGEKSSKIIKSWFYNDNYLLLLLFTVSLNSTKAHGL